MKKMFFILATLFFIYPGLAKEYFIIGDKEGEPEVLSPRQIEEGPDRNIYIYDQKLAFIKVFSNQGNFLRKMGGKGQGPGEIQRIDDVSFNFTYDKKMLYFTEFFGGHRWITFMTLAGKYHSVLKLKMLGKNYAILGSIPLKDGGFLATVSFFCTPESKNDYFLYRCWNAIVKINRQGEIVSEILKTGHLERISTISHGADLGIPFVPIFAWAPLKNNTIVFSEGLSDVFGIYDMKGKKTGEIKTPLPSPQPVTEEDLESWRKRLKNNFRDKTWFNRFGRVIYKYKKSVHKKKPNINALSLTPGNHLLIEGLWDTEKEVRPFWLLDLKGNTIIKNKIAGFDLKISDHFIFVGFRDEDDNSLFFCMPRKGTEAEDLLRLTSIFRRSFMPPAGRGLF